MASTNWTGSQSVPQSYQTLFGVLGKFARSEVPTRIARSTFTHLSGSAASRLVADFRFLGLSDDDGASSDALDALVESIRRDRYSDGLGQVISRVYGPILDGGSGSLDAVGERLLAAFPADREQHRRHFRFLRQACAAAQLPLNRAAAAGAPDQAGGAFDDEGTPPTSTVLPPSDRGDPPAYAGSTAWSASGALAALTSQVYDPDHIPPGSEAERSFMSLLAHLARLARA